MALAQRRISVVVEGSSSSLQSAIDKAVASLKTLGDVATKQSQAAIGWNDRVIASNDQLMASYARMAEAVKGSAGTITEAVKVERDAQVSLAGATDKATKSVVAAAAKQAGAYRDAGTVIDRSAKVQRDAIASVATAANRSAGDVAAASERSAAAQRSAADASVVSSRRTADGHAATAATASKSFASSGSALVRFGKLATEATAAVGLGSLYMAGKFEASSTRLLTQAGASVKEVKVLQQGMLDLAGSLGQTPQHLSEGLYHIVSSMEAILPPAHRTSDELKIMAVAAQEAAIGNTNMEETSYALASAMNALHAPASQAKNVMAEMNAIVGSGDMTMQDLLDALRSGLIPTARTFGVSFRSVGAALAVMGDLGMRGALAGTRLRMSLALLAAPSDKAAKMLTAIGMGAGEVHARTTAMSEALEKAGLTTTTMAEDLKKPNGIAVAFRDLQDHLRKAGLSSTDAAALMSRAFGGGRMGATIQLLEQQVGRLEAKYKQTGELTHKWGEDVAKTHETLAFQAKQAGAAVEALGIKIGRDLTPYAKTALHDLEELAKFFEHNDTAAKALAITLGGVVGIAMTAFVANRIAKMVEGLKQVRAGMEWIRNGFSSLPARAGAATTAEAGLASATTSAAVLPDSALHAGIFGARGPMAPGSITNPIVVALEAGSYAGLGGSAATIGASRATSVVGAASNEAQAARVAAETERGFVGPLTAEAAVAQRIAAENAAAMTRLGGVPAVTKGVTSSTVLPSVGTAGETAASSTLMGSIRGAIGTGLDRVLKGGMFALGGLVAGEVAKSFGAGKAITSGLTDAGVGAAIGTIIEPGLGTAIGAAVGGAPGFLKALEHAIEGASPAERHAHQVANPPGTRPLPPSVEAAINRERTKEEKAIEHIADIANRAVGTSHEESAFRKAQTETRRQEEYYQGREAAIAGEGVKRKLVNREPAKAGETIPKFLGLGEIVGETKKRLEELQKLPTNSAAATARSTATYAFGSIIRPIVQTLEHEGRLPKDALQKVLDQLKPLLTGAFPFAAGESAKAFHEQFLANLHTQDMVKRIAKTAQEINNTWGREFGLLPINTDMTFAEITQHASHDLGVLEHIMKTGTQQQREEAEKEYKLLAPGLKGYMAAASKEVEVELKVLSHKTGPEAQKATAAIVGKWEELPGSLKVQVANAGKEVKKGLDKMKKETEGDLRGLGSTNVGNVSVHISGSGQLHARGGLVQLGRQGQAGRDTIPLNVGGMNIVAAPGEKVAVFTRHQEAVANRELSHMGGLPGLFSKVNQPNYMASGGFVPSEAYPGPRGRIDQGVDYAGPGPVRAVLDGTVKSVGLWPGWPGTGGIVYNTAKGVVYVMENFAPAGGIRSGLHLKAGQVVGQDTGGAYGIETGWANATGTAPIVQYGAAPDGTPMPGGKNFASFLGGGPGGGIGGVVTSIVAPEIKAPGLIGSYGQNLLSKYASIANAIVSAVGGGAGGPSFGAPDTSALPAAARTRLNQIASERSWSVNDWLAVIGLESGGNPAARNPSGAYGIGQALGSTQREYPKMVSSNPAVQIEGMAEYISSRYHTPSAALAHEHAFHWYERGGLVGTPGAEQEELVPLVRRLPIAHGFNRDPEAEYKPKAGDASRFFSLARRVWSTVRAGLPSTARFPAMVIDREGTEGPFGAYTQNGTTVHEPWGNVWAILHGALAAPVEHNARLKGLVHEFAHTEQSPHIRSSRPEREGGAQGWADTWAPRVGVHSETDGNYAGFVEMVRQRKGEDWVLHKQFEGPQQYADLGGFVSRELEPTATTARSRSGLPGTTTINVAGSKASKTHTTPPKYHHAPTHKPHTKGAGKGKNLAGMLRNLIGIPDLEKLPEALAPDEKILGELSNVMNLVKTVESDPQGPVILPGDLQYLPGLTQHGVHAGMPTTEAYRKYESLLGSAGESPQLHLEGEIVKWAEGQADHRLLTARQAGIIAPATKGLHWSPKPGYAVLQIEEQVEVLEQNHLEAEEKHIGGVLFTLQRALAERRAREKRLKHLKAVTERRESHIKADLRRLGTASLKDKLAAAVDSAAQSGRVQDALEHKAAVHEMVTDISSIPSAQRTRAQNRELPGLKQEESGLNSYLVNIRNPIQSHKASIQAKELAILKNHLQGELVPLQARMKKVDSSELGVGIKGVQSEIKTILHDEPGAEEKLGEITGVKLPTVELNLEEIARSMQEAELPKIVPTAGGEGGSNAQELLNIQKQINAQLAIQNAVAEAQFATLKNFTLNVPRFDKGGPVLEDGLAYVHRGEHVVPRDGTLVAGGAAGPIHLNVQHNIHGDLGPLISLIDSRVSHPNNVASISQHMQRRVFNLPGYR